MASLPAVLPLPLVCPSITASAVLQVKAPQLLSTSIVLHFIEMYINNPLQNCLDTNCTDALVKAGPWCADPTWVLCNNNGFFCCLSGQTCYSDGNTDGCANPGQESVGPKQQVLQHMQQVPRSSIASTATTTSSGATSSSSSKPSQNNSGGLNTSDKIAIGIGVPVGVATILGSWASWKLYRRKKHKLGN